MENQDIKQQQLQAYQTLAKKLRIYCWVMGSTMIVANAFLFSPLSNLETVGGIFGIGLIFVLNPIAVCVAGRAVGLKKQYFGSISFVALLIASIRAGGWAFEALLKAASVKIKHGALTPMPLVYDAILIGLFIMWLLLGLSTRHKMKLLYKQSLEKALLEKHVSDDIAKALKEKMLNPKNKSE